MNLREQVSFGVVSKFNGAIEFRRLISENRGLRDGRIWQRTIWWTTYGQTSVRGQSLPSANAYSPKPSQTQSWKQQIWN